MSPSYKPFTLEVDDRAIEIITDALFYDTLRVASSLDDGHRVRIQRNMRNKTYEVLNRAATLQRVQR